MRIVISLVALSIAATGCSNNATHKDHAAPVKSSAVKTVKKAPPQGALAKSTRPTALPAQVRRRVPPVKVRPQSVPARSYPSTSAKHYQRVARKPVSRGLRSARKASFTGDFSSNARARLFVDRMVSQHRIDRQQLNAIMSSARATPFLKRMARADANYKKRTARLGSWSRYKKKHVVPSVVAKGTQFYNRYRHAFTRAEQQYGVPAEIILGIIGVETKYGGYTGKDRIIDALSTMAFMNSRRGRYFESELESYLVMSRNQGLNPLSYKGSYAGAIGLCQFMPSNINKYAVDFDGNGQIDLFSPVDAIGSVASYFKGHGWRSGEVAAVFSKTARSSTLLEAGFETRYSPAKLLAAGYGASRAHNMRGQISLIRLNRGAKSDYWWGGHNFYVITRYNHSTYYAMSVYQLAEALRRRIRPARRSI